LNGELNPKASAAALTTRPTIPIGGDAGTSGSTTLRRFAGDLGLVDARFGDFFGDFFGGDVCI
jgi:hypothetical protein